MNNVESREKKKRTKNWGKNLMNTNRYSRAECETRGERLDTRGREYVVGRSVVVVVTVLFIFYYDSISLSNYVYGEAQGDNDEDA